MKKSQSKNAESPSELIDARIEDLDDWRGEMLARLRALIKEAVPDVAEDLLRISAEGGPDMMNRLSSPVSSGSVRPSRGSG